MYDVKLQHIGILKEPLTCRVEQDRIVEVVGPAREQFLRVCDERGDILRYISEVSLGMNPAGVVTGAARFIPEEKNYGTLHCGHGGNASYGSRQGPHLDGVMGSPTVRIDGVPLMVDGRLIATCINKSIATWLEECA